jgi:hypothetical protein
VSCDDLEQFELVPVVELEPARFAPASGGMGDEGPEAYWLRSMAQGGMEGLVAITSWCVPVWSFERPAHLQRLLEVFLDKNGTRHDEPPVYEQLLDAVKAGTETATAFVEECVETLPGGGVLRSAGRIYSRPGCCADLADLQGWESASAYRESKPQMLWTGHPWHHIRYEDGRLVLSEATEESEATSSAEIARLAPSRLKAAVSDAQAHVQRFAERLRPIAEAAFGDSVGRRLVCKLVGLL